MKKNKTTFSAFSFVGESFSGTGDLFASVIAGAKARGDSLEASIDLAGRMIEQAMRDSAAENVPRNEGVEYEKYLWMLTGKERNS